MKNKEIEELLNSIDEIIKEAPDDAIYGIQIKEYKQIKNHIEQLERENETLGEIVNVKDEQLKEMQMQKTDYTAVNILEAKIEQLENNRDKAIEVINTQLKNAKGGLKDNLRIIKFNLIKGSCTFEDLKTEEDYKYILKGDSDVK